VRSFVAKGAPQDDDGLVVSFYLVAAHRADRFIDVKVRGVFGRHSERSEESRPVTYRPAC
jgi:hypothetical protein